MKILYIFKDKTHISSYKNLINIHKLDINSFTTETINLNVPMIDNVLKECNSTFISQTNDNINTAYNNWEVFTKEFNVINDENILCISFENFIDNQSIFIDTIEFFDKDTLINSINFNDIRIDNTTISNFNLNNSNLFQNSSIPDKQTLFDNLYDNSSVITSSGTINLEDINISGHFFRNDTYFPNVNDLQNDKSWR